MGLNKQPGQILYSRIGASYLQMHAVQGHILIVCNADTGRRLWDGQIANNGLWDGKGWDVLKVASMFRRWRREITTDKVKTRGIYHE